MFLALPQKKLMIEQNKKKIQTPVAHPSAHLTKVIENKTDQNMRDLRVSLTSGDENYMKECLKCGGIQLLL
jgi:hypothetical protein